MSGTNDVIHCPICLEVYRQPRALPCLHTFCQTCLQEFIDAAAQKGNIISGFECPVCRRGTKPPMAVPLQQWAEHFEHNHIIISLIDSQNAHSSENKLKVHLEEPTRKYEPNVQSDVKGFDTEFEKKTVNPNYQEYKEGDWSTQPEAWFPPPRHGPPHCGSPPYNSPPHHPPPHRGRPPHHGPPHHGPPPHHRPPHGPHHPPPGHDRPFFRGTPPHGRHRLPPHHRERFHHPHGQGPPHCRRGPPPF